MRITALCNLLFWILLFLDCQCIHAKIISLGPVQLFRRNDSFTWEASVDRTTGIASSKETSFKSLRDEKEFPAKRIFHLYPTWLCRFPVSFGLLRSVQTSRGGVCIRDRFFGRDLLIFGPAKSRLVSVAFQEGIVHNTYAIEWPITGGLLSIPAPRAALVFCLFTTHGQNGRTSSIVTRVSGYRPALTGQPPVSRIRSAVYVSTQSLIHAGVMWRFHRYCWSNRRRL